MPIFLELPRFTYIIRLGDLQYCATPPWMEYKIHSDISQHLVIFPLYFSGTCILHTKMPKDICDAMTLATGNPNAVLVMHNLKIKMLSFTCGPVSFLAGLEAI